MNLTEIIRKLHFVIKYKDLLKEYPYITRSITAGAIMSSADLVSQKIIEEKKDID